MPWLQLTFETTPEDAEQFSDLLSEAGAGAVTFLDSADQPLYEPPVGETPLWSHTRVMGLFDATTNINLVVEQISAKLAPKSLPDWRISPLEDKDWEREWMDNFKPMSFGKRLWIVPSWTKPPQSDAINILLDPGLAFGTGTHPTTAMCLRWLDAHAPQGMTVIDYGCGSGILAIAACKLGARHAIGVDTDPQALLATHDNAEKNQVGDCIDVYLPADFQPQPGPLLLANILAGPLQSLAPRFSELVQPAGHIVLSGILAEQAELVMQQYQTAFDIQMVDQQEDWVCLAGRRR